MDFGIGLTGLALAVCLVRSALKKRDPTLPCVLLALWTAALALWAAEARMATFVFSAAMLNLMIAGVAVVMATHEPGRIDTRVVGFLSLLSMPLHFGMSASEGALNWKFYAWSCNVIYITQCLVAGGWLDGLGRRIAGFFGRLQPVHLFRGRSG